MDEEPSAVIYNSSSTGITTISINRAARRNAVNPATARKLYDAFLRFEDDPTQKICVFHGDNGTFCAGADLSSSPAPLDYSSDTLENHRDGGGKVVLAIHRCNKSVIAAINGIADHKASPRNSSRLSKGKAILIPTAAEAESAVKISTIEK